ncbi:MAG: hypothetical protein AB1742_06000 [bacterium]
MPSNQMNDMNKMNESRTGDAARGTPLRTRPPLPPHVTRPIRSAGFTIVEIVVVIIILGLLLVPVMNAVARALMLSNEDEYLAAAAFLAVEKIEEFRLRVNCYSDIAGGCAGEGFQTADENFYDQNPCTFPSPFDRYKCRLDSEFVSDPGNRVREVQVRVWYDRDSDNAWDANEPRVELETMVTMRDPLW